MNRRKFFSNLVGSVAVLVTAHALPFQKLKRFAFKNGEMQEVINTITYERSVPTEENPQWSSVPLEILTDYKRALMNDVEYSNL